MLLTQLQQKENFSNAENVLASYILGNPDTALRLTLQKLADAAFVSKPTVIRLYRKLGFKNYSDFRLKFYSELASQQKYLDDIDPNLPFGRYDSCRSVARRISELMIQTITNCYGLIDEQAILSAAASLSQANRLLIFAIGDCFIRARSFQNKLIKINKYAILVNELHEDTIHICHASSEDAALILSFGGNFLRTYPKKLQALRKKGTKLILITSLTDPKLSSMFDTVILLDKGEDMFLKIATFSSQIAIEYILNVLYACIFKQEYDRNLESNREDYWFRRQNGIN